MDLQVVTCNPPAPELDCQRLNSHHHQFWQGARHPDATKNKICQRTLGQRANVSHQAALLPCQYPSLGNVFSRERSTLNQYLKSGEEKLTNAGSEKECNNTNRTETINRSNLCDRDRPLTHCSLQPQSMLLHPSRLCREVYKSSTANTLIGQKYNMNIV